MSADEKYEVFAYARYEFDCPNCGEPNDREQDPAGDDVTCESCGTELHVVETR